MWPVDCPIHDRNLVAGRAVLGDAVCDAAWSAGAAMPWEAAADAAMAWIAARRAPPPTMHHRGWSPRRAAGLPFDKTNLVF